MPESPKKWQNPSDVMKLQKLRLRKKALQSRINGCCLKDVSSNQVTKTSSFENIFVAKKRRNPFLVDNENKRIKTTGPPTLDESADQTLFKLLHQPRPVQAPAQITSFDNILSKINEKTTEIVEIVKAQGEKWLPIDWTLKTKMRLLSKKPFSWNQKLKISEEASGITSFTRCLEANTDVNLDTSPNARFHQCCLYWQQPSLPWMKLFPRSTGKASDSGTSIALNLEVRDSLQKAWFDSLRSLFQLIRTRQCPYFYVSSNTFTVLFRAAGICGFSDMHVVISPTTRGLRRLLKQEEIEFKMPLKKKRVSDQGYETLDSTVSESATEVNGVDGPDGIDDDDDNAVTDNNWLKSMGLNAEDIKNINYTQTRMVQKAECEVDNSEESLVLIEGIEVHSFYNFLLNCKSAVALTGPLAGVPPTLLAPVAFNGATLNALKVRENKVNVDDVNYYSLELLGPILPTTIHNLFTVARPEEDMTATFLNLSSTAPFSKVKLDNLNDTQGERVFGESNLVDCGLNSKVLERFCDPNSERVTNVECLKYTCSDNTFTWT